MKTDKRVLDVHSTLQGERVGMTIAPDAMSHIMAILTDLYSDPEMAVMREYSTNAYDAHIEAGVNLPIEVTLPTSLSPYLKIRDYGNGLDDEDIRRIYSQYGASTKRETDEQVGSLGLGCKSALTYTDQFTLQGIKNGVATQVAISRDEDGAGSMTIVAQYETDETSGVEITIPAKAHHMFAQKAHDLFRFWPEGTVLVNGQEPARLEGGFELSEGIFLFEKSRLNESYVVMGNVPYPFTPDDDDYYSIVAYVPMGAINFTPAREALNMTSKTKAVLADIGLRITNAKESAVQRMVDAAPTKPLALVASLRASRLFRYDGEITYRGKPIPASIDAKTLQKGEPFLVWRARNSSRYSRMMGEATVLPTSLFPKTIFITGFTPKNLTLTHRNKIKKYLQDNEIEWMGVEEVVMLRANHLQHSSWVERERVISFETIMAVKLEKTGMTSDRPTGAYDVVRDSSHSRVYTVVTEADDLADETNLFWEPYVVNYDGYRSWRDPNSNLRSEINRAREIMRREFPDAVFVSLKRNRIKKFERDFPQAQNVMQAARNLAQNWFDALTEEERNFLSIQKLDSREGWASLDSRKLHDPKLKTLVKAAKVKNDKLLARAESFAYLYEGDIEEITIDSFPLLDFPSRYDSTDMRNLKAKHVVLYLNAVYAASKTGRTGNKKEGS